MEQQNAAAADPFYKAHYVDCPARIRAALDAALPAAPGVIVDFGCGRGIKTLAMAEAYPEAEVIGVDITEAFRHARDFAETRLEGRWPANLRFLRITPGAPLADSVQADAIYSWSVLEHVDRPILPGVVADMRRALRPGGVVFSQIAPLYYSPYGSHLRNFVPEPWAHLVLSHDALRRAVLASGKGPATGPGSAEWMFARYEELNGITAAELFGYFRDAGFTPLREDTRQVPDTPPAHLALSHGEAALKTFELISVHRNGEAPAKAGVMRRLRDTLGG